jgi:hypothetical protein
MAVYSVNHMKHPVSKIQKFWMLNNCCWSAYFFCMYRRFYQCLEIRNRIDAYK